MPSSRGGSGRGSSPRDPDFEAKAARVLDLYAREWEGQPLGGGDYVISADERTSIQVRLRRHPSLPAAPGLPGRVEFEYRRGGALQYLAAWDVHRAKIFGRCEPATGIEPFGRLAAQVMTQEPYASARRVFWVVDNGSSHRGQRSARRLATIWPNLVLVHLPVHAGWLNQVEIYFPSSSARCSPPTTSPASPRPGSGCSRFSAATSRPPGLSSGSSPATTSFCS
jgi:DDE superfamily endonuclease